MCAEGKLTDVEYLPLSCSQMNIWNLEMAHPGLPINNICTALKIEGNLNLEYLQTCIELVYRAFPSLRTRITIRGRAALSVCDRRDTCQNGIF